MMELLHTLPIGVGLDAHAPNLNVVPDEDKLVILTRNINQDFKFQLHTFVLFPFSMENPWLLEHSNEDNLHLTRLMGFDWRRSIEMKMSRLLARFKESIYLSLLSLYLVKSLIDLHKSIKDSYHNYTRWLGQWIRLYSMVKDMQYNSLLLSLYFFWQKTIFN